ncbi:thioesterase-like superfamily-domain-containing protein [Aspergillus avenaceus]|uniref:Thioesterase-like superfamily-domain-containing protein n=1 Tax=Aspergillus avenaceus TaxID=36643 RepID=A0A5N6U5C6_ASPAV|nr:thioesterase-like superfamily-domain-containing protein [Aspergillus avenaceus]
MHGIISYMPGGAQKSLSEALDIPSFTNNECDIHVCTDICFGNVSCGGFFISLMGRFALMFCSRHPKLQRQPDIRSTHTQFYRPIMAAKAPIHMKVHVINVAKLCSALRVEAFQGDPPKICTSMHLLVTDLTSAGITVATGWYLNPPPFQVNLQKLETDDDPRWICYHPPFAPNGWHRAHSYVRTFVPVDHSRGSLNAGQWMTPGWDCEPLGSPIRQRPAKWTNSMIPFALDMNLIHYDYDDLFADAFGLQRHKPHTSKAVNSGKAQRLARQQGSNSWRASSQDGFGVAQKFINTTLCSSVEIKKRLPAEGVRWLYLRSELRHVKNSQMDIGSLLFDENMELIAVSHEVAQVTHSDVKEAPRSRL